MSAYGTVCGRCGVVIAAWTAPHLHDMVDEHVCTSSSASPATPPPGRGTAARGEPASPAGRHQTHYAGCWRQHPACAVAVLENITRYVTDSEKECVDDGLIVCGGVLELLDGDTYEPDQRRGV